MYEGPAVLTAATRVVRKPAAHKGPSGVYLPRRPAFFQRRNSRTICAEKTRSRQRGVQFQLSSCLDRVLSAFIVRLLLLLRLPRDHEYLDLRLDAVSERQRHFGERVRFLDRVFELHHLRLDLQVLTLEGLADVGRTDRAVEQV